MNAAFFRARGRMPAALAFIFSRSFAVSVALLSAGAWAGGPGATLECSSFFGEKRDETPAVEPLESARSNRPLPRGDWTPFHQAALDFLIALDSDGGSAVGAPEIREAESDLDAFARARAVQVLLQSWRRAIGPSFALLMANEAFAEEPDARELAELVEQERRALSAALRGALDGAREPLERLLLPHGNVALLEISPSRAGAFNAEDLEDLASAYRKFANRGGWRVSTLEESYVDGELRRTVLKIEGAGAYRALRMERGDHRFIRFGAQRGSRASRNLRFTRFAQVAVYRPPQPSEFRLNLDELEISTMRSSGPGGQHVNRTESGVRVLHRPTGLSVKVEAERSQRANRDLALELIAARLFARFQSERAAAARAARAQGRRNEVVTLESNRWTRTYDWTTNAAVADRAVDGRLEDWIAPRLESDLVRLLREWTGELERAGRDGVGRR